MMKTPCATIQFLDDPEPRLRLAAVALLAEYWRPGEVFAAPAIRSAFEDPEPAVRGGCFYRCDSWINTSRMPAAGLASYSIAFFAFFRRFPKRSANEYRTN